MEIVQSPPWAQLPAEVADHVRPHLPQVVHEVIEAVGREVPAYQRPIEGEFGRALRAGVEAALGRFLDLPGTVQEAATGADREVYVALGRGELLAGRTMEALLAAYRIGARIAFSRFAELAREGGLDADAIVPLAVATFAYIDELSAASIEGFAAEQSARTGELDRLRTELLALILSGTADPASVAHTARIVGWAVPDQIVPVLVPSHRSEGLAVALGPLALVAPMLEGTVALVPMPARPAQWTELRQVLTGRNAVVGLTAPWAEAAAALRPATLALRLLATGDLSDDPLLVGERLVDLIVHHDQQLTDALVAKELAPLAAIRDSRRQRLAQTLLAWLSLRGERARVAAELHIHPQTVAYRVGQLRTLFGDSMTDPDRRFALELALRAELGRA
jgi:hypothetical protein